MAAHKRPTIADREDDYRAMRRQMIISPARQDPFAGGRNHFNIYFICFSYQLHEKERQNQSYHWSSKKCCSSLSHGINDLNSTLGPLL